MGTEKGSVAKTDPGGNVFRGGGVLGLTAPVP